MADQQNYIIKSKFKDLKAEETIPGWEENTNQNQQKLERDRIAQKP